MFNKATPQYFHIENTEGSLFLPKSNKFKRFSFKKRRFFD